MHTTELPVVKKLQPALIVFLLVFSACMVGIESRPANFLAVFWPTNAVLLAVLAIIFNNLAGRRYPHPLASAEAKSVNLPIDAVSIIRADLHEALMQGELFDIDEDDLQEILLRAEQLAHQRQNLN